MQILVYRWDIYPYDAIIDTLKKQGHSTDVLAFPISNHISDTAFSSVLEKKLKEKKYDMVFSVNYYAVIAEICHSRNLHYVAWTCDTPLLSMLHPSINYPTNFIFTFDKAEYKKFRKRGHSRIFYLPLAGMTEQTKTCSHDCHYLYDISFVGSLYEKNRYEEMCNSLPEKLCGYMDAVIEAGKRIMGGNFISQMLTEEILSEVARYVSIAGDSLSEDALKIHFETAVLSYKIASDTRIGALWLLSQAHDVHLFTASPSAELIDAADNISIHPPVAYQTKLPEIYRNSKINLNFTIPNISDGIPLRVFDVLSAGGFLLTDRRDAMCELFDDGIDLVIFDGMTDMMEKAGYYLLHPTEREQIAQNGMEKVRSLHTYDKRLENIFQIISVD